MLNIQVIDGYKALDEDGGDEESTASLAPRRHRRRFGLRRQGDGARSPQPCLAGILLMDKSELKLVYGSGAMYRGLFLPPCRSPWPSSNTTITF